jgi:DNA ligase (NAD+)
MNLIEKTDLYLKAKQAYYFETPIMSDAQFDALEDEIRREKPDAPELKIVGAPLPQKTGKTRARHVIAMGSQEKVNTADELTRWESLRANDASQLFHVSLKVDGSSLALYYQRGQLVQAVTRGDGLEGEDISFQAPLFQNVPARLALPVSIGIRCEGLVTLPDWPKADPAQESNPRNIASGILGRLDTKKSQLITTMAFDLDAIDDRPWEELACAQTETERSLLLEKLGFKTVPWKGNLTLAEVQAYYKEILAQRASLPYWIDGIIVRYEDLTLQKSLGSADGRPKGQVAWKFPAEGAPTILRKVEWQVGHSGAITPVGILDPVSIGGTIVTKASLANAGNITALKAFLNAKVTVVKAGDIIPQITSVDEEYDSAKGHLLIHIPQTCPDCEAAVERKTNVDGSNSAVLFCVNPDCSAQTAGKIRRFAKSRDILGLGDSIIAGLLDEMAISSVADLPRLKPEAIENVLINPEKAIRLGRKRAEAICAEIAEKTREMTLAEFLGAFGTRGLGVRRATLMIGANPELDDIERWFDDSLLNPDFAQRASVPQLGRIIQEDLKANEGVIRSLLEHINIKPTTQPMNTNETTTTNGQPKLTICITGKLPSGRKKHDYAEPLNAAGHRLVDDLTKEVNVLVMADPFGPESSKTKKAKKLGIELHDESWLQGICAA